MRHCLAPPTSVSSFRETARRVPNRGRSSLIMPRLSRPARCPEPSSTQRDTSGGGPPGPRPRVASALHGILEHQPAPLGMGRVEELVRRVVHERREFLAVIGDGHRHVDLAQCLEHVVDGQAVAKLLVDGRQACQPGSPAVFDCCRVGVVLSWTSVASLRAWRMGPAGPIMISAREVVSTRERDRSTAVGRRRRLTGLGA